MARGLVAPGVWDLPQPGIELVSPALAGAFLTSGPRGKSKTVDFCLSTHGCILRPYNNVEHTASSPSVVE